MITTFMFLNASEDVDLEQFSEAGGTDILQDIAGHQARCESGKKNSRREERTE